MVMSFEELAMTCILVGPMVVSFEELAIFCMLAVTHAWKDVCQLVVDL